MASTSNFMTVVTLLVINLSRIVVFIYIISIFEINKV